MRRNKEGRSILIEAIMSFRLESSGEQFAFRLSPQFAFVEAD
jgi:hypothetical protein